MDGNRKTIIMALTLILLAGGLAFALDGAPGPAGLPWQRPQSQLPPAPESATLFFAGDVMLSREVNARITAANDPGLPYAKVREEIRNADISFANLESPFSPTSDNPTNRLVFQARPSSVTGLVDAGFDVLSTANNHAFDQGLDGVEYTLSLLKQNGIKPVGTGLDCHEGRIMNAKGMKVGYLAYSYAAYNDGGAVQDPMSCDWNDTAQMRKDIQALRSSVDYLIVSAHMGEEYRREPEGTNVLAARAAIDAGADAVIGHHPHWHQVMEEYKGRYIFYSLGNFVFDQMWSQETREGLAVQMLFKDKKLDTITLLPVVIDDYCCPRWANEEETKSILGKANLTSPLKPGKN